MYSTLTISNPMIGPLKIKYYLAFLDFVFNLD